MFGARAPVSQDEWNWLLAGLKWLNTEFGQDEANLTPLILPTPDFFPPVSSDPDQAVSDILDQVKAHSGMSEWPTILAVGDHDRPTELGRDMLLVHDTNAPLGHFRLLKDATGQHVGEIAYNPDQRDDPVGLIATLAHELSHYLMAYAKTVMPGGEEMMEHSTDLCAVYLGFGIFLTNNSFSFSASEGGGYWEWHSQAAGYLSERSLLTAMAIRERLQGRDPLDAIPYLKPHLAKDLKSITKYVRKRDLETELADIDLEDYGVLPYPQKSSDISDVTPNISIRYDID
ncbi:MAG: hypothetical protein AAGH53_06855 [Pseudomonadota bacterium]